MATMQQIVAGFSWPSSVDLSRKDNRLRLSPAALKGLFRIAAHWKLKDEATRALLGGISSGSFYILKSDATSDARTMRATGGGRRSAPHPMHGKALDQDQLTRISLLIGIYKALNILFGQDLADAWISLPNTNPMFGGQSPIDYMKAGGIPAFVRVRQLLDARRGGR